MNRNDYRHILKSLNFKSHDLKSLYVLLLNVMMLAASFFLLSNNSVVANILGGLLLGIQMHHSYVIVHECTHNSFVSHKALNCVIGHIMGVCALLPFFNRKHEHIDHHVWTGNVHKEPATKRAMSQFHIESTFKSFVLQICWGLWLPIFTINEHKNLWILPFTKDNSLKSRKKTLQCWFSMALTILIIGTLAVALFSYMTSVLAVSLFIAAYIYFLSIEVFNLPHHVDSELYEGNSARPLWEHDVLSKSCKKLPFGIGTYYMLNFNYHIEHHFFPALPWTELEKAHFKLVDFDKKYGELIDEFEWNRTLRKNSVTKVFDKYYAYMKTQRIV